MNNMKLGARLGLGFAIVLLLLGSITLIGVNRIGLMNGISDKIINHDWIGAKLAARIESHAKSNAVKNLELFITDDAESIRRIRAQINENKQRISQDLGALEKLLESAQGKALFQTMKDARMAYVASFTRASTLLLEKNDREAAARMFSVETLPALQAFMGSLQSLVEYQESRLEQTGQESFQAYSTARLMLLALGGLAALVGVIMAMLITRSITRPMALATSVAEAIAHGKLDNSIDLMRGDETGKLLDSMRTMQTSLQRFANAQTEMTRHHRAGEIDAQMPAADFEGAYREMARSTNEMAAVHIGVQRKILDVMGRYADGDFSVDMEQLPGQLLKITEAVATVKRNLQAISGDIAALVGAAARGDFTARGEVERYRHEFQGMVAALNTLMDTSERGLNDVARVLAAIARGDLTEKIVADYQGTFAQLKDDSNRSVEQLEHIIGRIREATETINIASREIATGNTDLSRRTEEQAASLQQTASSVEELTTTVKQNAENASEANQLAANASIIAAEGGRAVSLVVETMGAISDSSKKISDIIGVIDGIAFQTNILALNAAVEAARAGEQGRGFAVVATEVRNLAQRSAQAAKEIKGLISDSVEKVESGAKLVDAAGRTMDEVVGSVRRVSDIIAEITVASAQQSAGIEQVSQAIVQIDQVTQQNATLVEEAAAAAESMEEQAHGLAQAVEVFKTGATSAGKRRRGTLAAPALTSSPQAAPRRLSSA